MKEAASAALLGAGGPDMLNIFGGKIAEALSRHWIIDFVCQPSAFLNLREELGLHFPIVVSALHHSRPDEGEPGSLSEKRILSTASFASLVTTICHSMSLPSTTVEKYPVAICAFPSLQGGSAATLSHRYLPMAGR
jgi:hypothetical protein